MNASPAAEPEARFRRILVVFESPAHAEAMFDALADLAGRLHAELHGLYVEDANLVRLIEHTETSAYRIVTYSHRAAEQGLLARAMRAQAVQSRRLVEEVTRRRRVRSTFQVGHGGIAAEILAAARTRDLIVIPKNLNEKLAGGMTALLRALSENGAQSPVESVLLFNPNASFAGDVMTVYDGSPAAAAALDLAGDMAALAGGAVEVVMLTPRLNAVESWQNEIYNRLHRRGIEVSFLHSPEMHIDQLCARSRRPRSGLIVFGFEQPVLRESDVEMSFVRMDCSVMLTR